MKFASIVVLSITASASAETLFRLSDSMWVWPGGFAASVGHGWIGSGWNEFPGLNPPWNPITAQPQPPIVVLPPAPVPMPEAPLFPEPTGGFTVIPMPEPPPISTTYIRIGDQLIPQTNRW